MTRRTSNRARPEEEAWSDEPGGILLTIELIQTILSHRGLVKQAEGPRRCGPPPAIGPNEVAVNTAIIRQLNVSRIFHALREHPGSSQRELSRLTGVDRATVSTVVQQLEREGLVSRRRRPRRGRAGRPEEELRLAEAGGVFVGVRLERDDIRLLATGLDARPRAELHLDGSPSPTEGVARVAAGVTTLAGRLGVPLASVLGVGVGVPALTDLDGRLVFGPNLGWRDVSLRELLRSRIDVPIYVDNDTKAAALAETLFGSCRGVSDFLIVIGHSGVGGGLYLGGKLHRGRRGFAGELGHSKVVPDGRACGCGGRGCLEAYLSEPNLLARLRDAGAPCRDLEEAARRARDGDVAVRRVMDESGALLGRVLADALNLLNLQKIVLGGRIAVLTDALAPAVLEVLQRDALDAVHAGVTLEASPLGAEAVAIGGVALAMEGFLSLPSWLAPGALHAHGGAGAPGGDAAAPDGERPAGPALR